MTYTNPPLLIPDTGASAGKAPTMPYHLFPVPFSIALISAYMVARNRNDLKRTAIIQPLTTAYFLP